MAFYIDDIYIGKICILSNNNLKSCPFYSAFYKKHNNITKHDEYYLINRGKLTNLTLHFKHNQKFSSIDDLYMIADDNETYYYVDGLVKLNEVTLIEPPTRILESFGIHNYLSYINEVEKKKIKRK